MVYSLRAFLVHSSSACHVRVISYPGRTLRELAQRACAFVVMLCVVLAVGCDAILGTLHDRPADGGEETKVDASMDAHGRTDARPIDASLRADAGHDTGLAHLPDAPTLQDALKTPPDATPQPASCSGVEPGAKGILDCPGEGGVESCCTSLEVYGGTVFDRAYNADDAGLGVGDGGRDSGATAMVSGFRLDKYLVTVGRFRRFVTARYPIPKAAAGLQTFLHGGHGLQNSADGGYEQGWSQAWNGNVDASNETLLFCAPDAGANMPLNTWTSTPGANESLPITCETWWEAYAFCIWDGGFLPSEAEWEYAAAGGMEQRNYPWGSTDPGQANQYAIYDGYYDASSPFAPVGSAPQGAARWGQLDMAGEAYEWTLDVFAPFVTPCQDCAYLLPLGPQNPQNELVQKTKRYAKEPESPTEFLTPPYRSHSNAMGRNYSTGFRCARAP
jgi:formylglycine-generating enzyme required for sulfatase activity